MINTEQTNIKSYMNTIETLLKMGSNYLLSNLGNSLIETNKGERDFALKTDIALEKIYTDYLLETHPNIPILGEELSPQLISKDFKGLFWAIDPIDGTINYSRALPEYGTSIALIKNRKPIAIGICFPSLKEFYIAGLNEGAYLNGNKIKVSNNSELKSSVLAFGDFSVKDNYIEKNNKRFKYLTSFANNVLRIRMPGSAALQLAWLAAGKIDISLTLSNNAWDVQGGVLLVREAGGDVYDFDGSEHSTASKYTIASNKATKKTVLEFISKIEVSR